METYTKLNSKDIDNLVMQFRAGDSDAGEKLLEAFSSLIGKYLKLMFHGTFNKNDKDITKFLEACGKKDINTTAEILRKKLRKYEAEELVQIAKVALLETAIEFISISGSYKYVLHRRMKSLIFEEVTENLEVDLSERDLLGHHVPDSYEIDEEWIKGNTTGDAFLELTEEQRKIVKLVWNDRMPDIHVSKVLNISIYLLNKEKERIKETLAKCLNLKKQL